MNIEETLKGKILTSIEGMEVNSPKIIFTTSEGDKYIMYHSQNCCEGCDLEDVNGNPSDLLDNPLTLVEVRTNEYQGRWCDSNTWTFYLLATERGYVHLRWHGYSNGYYSESVDFEKFDPEDYSQKKVL